MSSEPRCTYRLQLTSDFQLDQVVERLDYLEQLGVSHIYLSPILRAAPGSTHGYDVVDRSTVDPRIGGNDALQRLVEAVHSRRLSILLDIVPNHMAINTRENLWWWDVLRFGRASQFAEFFDVDWDPPESKLKNKILLPVLGDHYGRCLMKGELSLVREDDDLLVRYGDRLFPLNPDSLAVTAEAHEVRIEDLVDAAKDPEALHGLLELQHYRLAYWKTASRDLGYRRFFDITSLVGLRVEEPHVFEAVHKLVLGWIGQGWIDGLRIDHIDGLYDPYRYLTRLRERIGSSWLIVEKILEEEERLPSDWPVDGTTGYDFSDISLRALLHEEGLEQIRSFYKEMTKDTATFEEIAGATRNQVLSETLASDLNYLTGLLVDICETHREFRDLTRHDLHDALRDVLSAFDVYRTYVRPDSGSISDRDEEVIDTAIGRAEDSRADLPPEVFQLLRRLLKLQITGPTEGSFVARLQQLSSAVMAKGLEDTAFYRYAPFIALNEVGSSPEGRPVDIHTLHREGQRRAQELPRSMLTTSTHDTKRGEDVAARLAVLTEIPDRWSSAVRAWMREAEAYRRDDMPETEMIYLMFQTLVGAHPLSHDRLWEYMLKAAREAKRFTSWTAIDDEYEKTLERFVEEVAADARLGAEIEEFVGTIRDFGWVNSLSRTLMKLTFPGVPDVYQGSELWNLSLVDPDNRRPVDYGTRSEILAKVDAMSARDAWDNRERGDPKLLLIQRALDVRRQVPDAFGPGADYQPVLAEGTHQEHVAAWARDGKVVSVAPLRPATIRGEWHDTRLQLPEGRWVDRISGDPHEGEVAVGDLLASFPVALLTRR